MRLASLCPPPPATTTGRRPRKQVASASPSSPTTTTSKGILKNVANPRSAAPAAATSKRTLKKTVRFASLHSSPPAPTTEGQPRKQVASPSQPSPSKTSYGHTLKKADRFVIPSPVQPKRKTSRRPPKKVPYSNFTSIPELHLSDDDSSAESCYSSPERPKKKKPDSDDSSESSDEEMNKVCNEDIVRPSRTPRPPPRTAAEVQRLFGHWFPPTPEKESEDARGETTPLVEKDEAPRIRGNSPNRNSTMRHDAGQARVGVPDSDEQLFEENSPQEMMNETEQSDVDLNSYVKRAWSAPPAFPETELVANREFPVPPFHIGPEKFMTWRERHGEPPAKTVEELGERYRTPSPPAKESTYVATPPPAPRVRWQPKND